MEIKDLYAKLVAVLGFGVEGRATAAYLIKHGIKPVLFDQKPWNKWSKEDQELIKSLNVNFIFGPDCFKELAGFDVAFRSPGIKLSAVSRLETAITSQTKWFFDHCPAKIIGITGTKGKGTTANLIYEILKLQATSYELKTKSYLTGNIGKTQPLEILDNLSANDYVVYELSSFQLQDLTKSPHIGVVLMVTKEHLDYHLSENAYVEAKSPITKFQTISDFAVINADFSTSMQIGKYGDGQKVYFSRIKPTDCFVKDSQIVFTGSSLNLPIPSLQLRGAHNLENVCAAICVGKISGVDDKTIHNAVIAFKGLEHRLELVVEKSGIKFYNDSFSTTPETAIAAINSFTGPEIIILGGSTKNSDFSELAKTITAAKNIKAVILIGAESDNIKTSIQAAGGFRGKFLESAKNMSEIFQQIKSVAKPGDVVLFSPACASFDMFKSYVDRGNQFKEAVKNYSN